MKNKNCDNKFEFKILTSIRLYWMVVVCVCVCVCVWCTCQYNLLKRFGTFIINHVNNKLQQTQGIFCVCKIWTNWCSFIHLSFSLILILQITAVTMQRNHVMLSGHCVNRFDEEEPLRPAVRGRVFSLEELELAQQRLHRLFGIRLQSQTRGEVLRLLQPELVGNTGLSQGLWQSCEGGLVWNLHTNTHRHTHS